jgi:hypothetical protein
MDDAEHDVLAYMTFAAQHRTKLHSTNPLERLNKKVKRRADVVGPNEESIVRLVGAVLMEQNNDWQTQNRYMQIEGFAEPADKTAVIESPARGVGGIEHEGHQYLCPSCLAEARSSTLIFLMRCRAKFMFWPMVAADLSLSRRRPETAPASP